MPQGVLGLLAGSSMVDFGCQRVKKNIKLVLPVASVCEFSKRCQKCKERRSNSSST